MACPVDPLLGVLGSPMWQCFSSGGQAECCIVVLFCQTGGLMSQQSEDRSLRTQARPRFLGYDMAVTIYRPESRSRASGVRVRIRRLFRLDILSLMAPSRRWGGTRGHGDFPTMGVVRSSQLQRFFCRTIETCWLAPGQ